MLFKSFAKMTEEDAVGAVGRFIPTRPNLGGGRRAVSRDTAASRLRHGWHPGVRVVLALLVAVPVACTALLVSFEAASSWNARQEARNVAIEAHRLALVAADRAKFNELEVPMTAVAYAEQVGVNEPELDHLLKPSVPFRVQLTEEAARLDSSPTFAATPALRSDLVQVKEMIPKVEAGTGGFSSVHALLTKMAGDVDSLWYRHYDLLQADIAAWQPPGSFEVHTSALYQTYQAFLAGGHEIEGGIYVLEGTGPPGSKAELIQAAGDFTTATHEFTGHLSGAAQEVWRSIAASPADRQFAGTIAEGLRVALTNSPAPFVGNLNFAGSSMRPGLDYLGDLDHLVTAAAQDLSASANQQAHQAAIGFTWRAVFLFVLFFGCAAAVLLTSRYLVRPLRGLSKAAREVQAGHFDIPSLDEIGPREVVETTSAFNDMTGTLQAVEAKAVALSAEDLTDPHISVPLPGQTGLALQSTIDRLAQRIREREAHRQQLHEAATHDRLTGLFNRGAVFDYLTTDVSRRRFDGETVAVLFVDLDGLKPLNDNFGHEVGDAAIVATGEVLVDTVEGCDVVGRLGGDEFLIVLCHEHSSQGDEIVQRIHGNLSRRKISIQDLQVPLTASVGVALSQCGPDTDPMELVRQADHAMYDAKKVARTTRDLAAFGRR